MPAGGIKLAREIGRVPSSVVALDAQQERRFQSLIEQIVMVDVHEHPMVLPEEMEQLPYYLRTDDYRWGYQAVKQVGLMLSDLSKQTDVVRVGDADDIEAAKQRGIIGFLPTLEHLAIGKELNRLDILRGIGIRLAGLTYNRKNYIGDGQFERNDGGLSDFGIAVVQRMNDLGMAIDLSHASFKTAMDAIHFSRAPVAFSHNAAFSIRPVPRCRNDEELAACAQKGGLIAITAVPNSLSDDPEQDIECVLDHYDYMVNLVGVDHVGIGTDTSVGDHVAFHRSCWAGLLSSYPLPIWTVWNLPPTARTSCEVLSAGATLTPTSPRSGEATPWPSSEG
jgi:membrane dipeptidase